MPLFLINARDKANSTELRLANRDAHLKWAGQFGDQIAMAGPVLSEDGQTMKGSTFVIAFDSLADAEAWAKEDPYAKAGLFETTEIIPFKWLIGDGPKGD
ncbi:MAG: YciI family protein [Hyphomonadaceae bacterium]|nr:YciI family protein [Hyphomonadaceae bacterium]